MEKIYSARVGEALDSGERFCVTHRGFSKIQDGKCPDCGETDPNQFLDPEAAHRDGWFEYLDDD